MTGRRVDRTISPLEHALIRAQKVAALKAEREERRRRLSRDLAREQADRKLRMFGIDETDSRWPEVSKAVHKACAQGLDWKNEPAVRAVADKAVASIQRREEREITDIIYYIRCGDLIKLGTTSNLKRRMKAYPPGSELLATETGSFLLETERVEQFAEYLAGRREWFTPGPRLIAHIEELQRLDNLDAG